MAACEASLGIQIPTRRLAMMRSALLLLTLCVLLPGCGGATSQLPPFEGYWRKYDDEHGGFVEFKSGQIRLGDQTGSRSGPYTFTAASQEEPLYRMHAKFSDGPQDLQLHYEGDTIHLISDKVSGMYEIIVELVPIER
jgi:hypothetical protein